MRKTVKILAVLLLLTVFFASAYLVLRPWLLRTASQKQAQSAVEEFFSEYHSDQNYDPEPTAPSTPTESEETPERPYAELYAAMQEYNRQIFAEKQSNLRDPWSYTVPALDLTEYGLDADAAIAVLQIPSIGVELPVYCGASTKNLSKGAVLLSQTSFPIGGENTNAVLGAHRGWGGEDYLRNIEKVQIGDEILVTNLWKTLHYAVVEIKIIERLIRGIFGRAKAVNEQELLQTQLKDATGQMTDRLKQAKNELAKCTRELGKWEELMLSSVEGTCVFTPEQIKRRMDTLQEKAATLSDEIQTLQQKASAAERTAQEILQQHRQLLSWADLFADASTDEKKMVTANLLRAVRISRDYGIEVEFNISEAQYLNGLEMGY